MGTIKTTMTADAQQLINEQKRVGQSAAEVNNEYREASRELAQLGRVSSQVFREMSTPLDKYNKQMEALNKDLERGKITQEKYNEAVGHVRDKYEAALEKGGKFSELMSSFAAHAGGFLAVSSAISAVTDSLKEAVQEAENAQQKFKDRFTTRGELAQVYGSLAEADSVSAQFRTLGGATTRQMADQNAFAIQSAGLLKDLPTLLQVGGTGLVGSESLPELIGSIKSLRDAFTAAEAGGTEAILSKALVASAISKAPAQKLVQAASKAGAGASALGFSDEETLASIAVLTDPLGSPEEATTRLRALFRAIEKSGIKAGSLSEAVQTIQKRTQGGESFGKIFGSDNAEATEAARLLISNFGAFAQVSGQITAANSGQVLRDKLSMLGEDIKQASMMNNMQTEGGIEVAREDLAPRSSLINSLIEDVDELNRLKGRPMIVRKADRMLNSLSKFDLFKDWEGSLVQNVEQQKQAATAAGDTKLLEVLTRIDETQKRLASLIEQQRTQQQQRPTVPKPDRGG